VALNPINQTTLTEITWHKKNTKWCWKSRSWLGTKLCRGHPNRSLRQVSFEMVQWFQKRNSGTCIISPYFVPSQDLDFQHHLVFFLCQVISVKVVWFMGFNATLNNISAKIYWGVLYIWVCGFFCVN
jgi:hypothetical protein